MGLRWTVSDWHRRKVRCQRILCACIRGKVRCQPSISTCQCCKVRCRPSISPCQRRKVRCQPSISSCQRRKVRCQPSISTRQRRKVRCQPSIFPCQRCKVRCQRSISTGQRCEVRCQPSISTGQRCKVPPGCPIALRRCRIAPRNPSRQHACTCLSATLRQHDEMLIERLLTLRQSTDRSTRNAYCLHVARQTARHPQRRRAIALGILPPAKFAHPCAAKKSRGTRPRLE